MLKHVRVIPIAAESLGVRSMCTYVETPDSKILLDAGVSLCPDRFGLPPHPAEFRAIESCRQAMASAAEKAAVITLSHYHFDHHTPSFEDWLCNWTEAEETARIIYEGKEVWVKNPKEHINYSQRQRGWLFRQTAGKCAKKIEIADGKTFQLGETVIRFSEPVFHGPENSFLGWVLMTTIESRGEKFLFAPDVQGPMSGRTTNLILEESPDLAMVGGPPSYLSRFKNNGQEIRAGLGNLRRIVQVVPNVILDHHILRDESWLERTKDVFEEANRVHCKLVTSAEFLGRDNNFLETARKNLYKENPPSGQFQSWARRNSDAQKRVKPPL